MFVLMQNRPLLISGLVDYAASCHGDREIVSRDPNGLISRTTYTAVAERAKRLIPALEALGDRLRRRRRDACLEQLPASGAVLWCNRAAGRILHTVNPRLFPDQIQYIINHAEDAYVFFDPVFVKLIEQLALLICRGCGDGWRSVTMPRCRW